MSFNYQSYYRITLLDDLHNYFPDILYGTRGRFRNVDDLLDYIRSQVRDQFDLFSNARNNFHNRNIQENNNFVRDFRPVTTEPLRQAAPLANDDLNSIPIIYNTDNISELSNIFPDNNIINTLESIVGILYPTANNNRSVLQQISGRTVEISGRTVEPVVVRPTQEQITNATSIVELSNNTDVCAICQESMVDGIIRRINHCRHTFHDTCINRNFQRNVRCPICRYDIRG